MLYCDLFDSIYLFPLNHMNFQLYPFLVFQSPDPLLRLMDPDPAKLFVRLVFVIATVPPAGQ